MQKSSSFARKHEGKEPMRHRWTDPLVGAGPVSEYSDRVGDGRRSVHQILRKEASTMNTIRTSIAVSLLALVLAILTSSAYAGSPFRDEGEDGVVDQPFVLYLGLGE